MNFFDRFRSKIRKPSLDSAPNLFSGNKAKLTDTNLLILFAFSNKYQSLLHRANYLGEKEKKEVEIFLAQQLIVELRDPEILSEIEGLIYPLAYRARSMDDGDLVIKYNYAKKICQCAFSIYEKEMLLVERDPESFYKSLEEALSNPTPIARRLLG
jgi:hypothetical protein